MWLTILAIDLIVILFFIIDTKKNNRSPWGWMIFTLIAGTVPLGIYLVKTKRKGWGWFWIIFESLPVALLFGSGLVTYWYIYSQ